MTDDELALHDGVTLVRIDRAERRNAIDSATVERLHDEFIAFDEDPDLRVAVLAGDEHAFCAGADLTDLPWLRPSGPLGPTRLQLSKPVIAAIEGWCVAGGLELAAWCDLRGPRSSGARFGCLERRWGVPLIDGGTYRLPRIIGLGRALDWILTGREVEATEAADAGFVTRLVPQGSALSAAVELAGTIAAAPWNCVVHDRRSLYEGLGLDVDDGLVNEDRLGQEVIFADGFLDGVARFGAHQADRADRVDRADRERGRPRRTARARSDRLHRLRRALLPPHLPA